jgi:hypothetical protein
MSAESVGSWQLQHHDDASVLQHFAQGMVLQEQINGTGR